MKNDEYMNAGDASPVAGWCLIGALVTLIGACVWAGVKMRLGW